MGTEVSITKGSPLGGQPFPSRSVVPVKQFTLRDLYVHASISGNSLAIELDRYLNIDGATFSSSSNEVSQSGISNEESDIHERALAAILEVVTSNSSTTFEYVRAPEPTGGVQEWWARMLSGSLNNPQPTSGYTSIGESL